MTGDKASEQDTYVLSNLYFFLTLWAHINKTGTSFQNQSQTHTEIVFITCIMIKSFEKITKMLHPDQMLQFKEIFNIIIVINITILKNNIVQSHSIRIPFKVKHTCVVYWPMYSLLLTKINVLSNITENFIVVLQIFVNPNYTYLHDCVYKAEIYTK